MRETFRVQREAIAYMSRVNHPALFMQMRLGKTLVAIRSCLNWKARHVLVVAPLSPLMGWEGELRQEGQKQVQFIETNALPDPPRSNGQTTWTLINYERLVAAFKKCDNFPWWQDLFNVVILDESTRIKNPKSQMAQVCCEWFRDAAHRVILTGLPDPEGEFDYFQQFKFLHGKFMGLRNFWNWRYEWFQLGMFNWDPKPGTRGKIKEQLHELAFVRSRKQAGVGSPKLYRNYRIKQTQAQTDLIRQVYRDWEMGSASTKWVLVKHNWLAKIAGGHGEGWKVISPRKAEVLRQMIQDEYPQEPVVVFFRFNAELRLAWRTLREAGITGIWITGDTEPRERERRRQKFQNGYAQVAFLQEKCCKFGMDFSATNAGVYYSNSWSLEERMQSEDRLIHPNKTEPIQYTNLVTEGTPDEDVADALRDKNVSSKFFLGKLVAQFRRRLERGRVS